MEVSHCLFAIVNLPNAQRLALARDWAGPPAAGGVNHYRELHMSVPTRENGRRSGQMDKNIKNQQFCNFTA